MEFETFITRLQEVKNISRIENGYGHIICELFYNDILDNDKYKAATEHEFMSK